MKFKTMNCVWNEVMFSRIHRRKTCQFVEYIQNIHEQTNILSIVHSYALQFKSVGLRLQEWKTDWKKFEIISFSLLFEIQQPMRTKPLEIFWTYLVIPSSQFWFCFNIWLCNNLTIFIRDGKASIDLNWEKLVSFVVIKVMSWSSIFVKNIFQIGISN